MSFLELDAALSELVPVDSDPVVVYSGIWSLSTAYIGNKRELPDVVLKSIQSAVGINRTMLMPCYTNGFKEPFLDLDNEPGLTGIVNERFRKTLGTKRTASAYFSFACSGKVSEVSELVALRPKDAWGDGSVFDWIERKNAYLLMVGEPWKMCSFLHRLEWSAKVPYRYLKEFSGEILLNGQKQRLEERLFVRSLDPLAENIWPQIDELLEAGGMQYKKVGASRVSIIRSRMLLNILGPILKNNPYVFVKNAEELQKKYG